MSEPTFVDFVYPSIAAGLLTVVWAALVMPLTYFVVRRVELKWVVALVGTVASLTVLVGGLLFGALSWAVYWAGFKNADITEPRAPVSSTDALLDPGTWAILVPLITPMVVLFPIMFRWKKVGERIGVDWS